MKYEQALQNALFRYKAGSHAYGTNMETSDDDFRGVFMAPLSHAFDLFQTSFMGQGTIKDHLVAAINDVESYAITAAKTRIERALETDQGDLNFSVGTVQLPGADEELHELRKFLKLAADNNPNIIEFLYVDRGITHQTEEWEKIRDHRHLFLSKKAKATFFGYATAQLKRIRNHRGYLLNPPGEKPKRSDFGLPEETTVPKEHRGAILSLPDGLVDASIRETVRAEKRFETAMTEWRSYNKWAKERNEKRKVLEKKCGYDSKHASHLVRLLRMAYEILTVHNVIVFRPDREELLDIRLGNWKYDRLMEHVEELEVKIEEAAKTSDLRQKADHKKIAELYREIAEERYCVKVG